jgi:hypothetical protein
MMTTPVRPVIQQGVSAHLHFYVLFTCTSLFGMMLSRGLLALGLMDLIVRSSIAMTASYFFFLLAVKFWLGRMREDAQALTNLASQSELGRLEPKSNRSSFWTELPLDLPETPVVLFALLIIGILAWVGIEGPVILIDAAFELALSAGLVSSTKQLAKNHWHGRVVKRTILPFLIILLASVCTLNYALSQCPGKSRVSQLITECKGN